MQVVSEKQSQKGKFVAGNVCWMSVGRTVFLIQFKDALADPFLPCYCGYSELGIILKYLKRNTLKDMLLYYERKSATEANEILMDWLNLIFFLNAGFAYLPCFPNVGFFFYLKH